MDRFFSGEAMTGGSGTEYFLDFFPALRAALRRAPERGPPPTLGAEGQVVQERGRLRGPGGWRQDDLPEETQEADDLVQVIGLLPRG